MLSSSNVTAAFRASARPSSVTPVVIVIDFSARMLPLNDEYVPRGAELPTCQKTLQAVAPPSRVILLLLPVVSEDPIWKMNPAAGLPPASSLSSRLSDIVEADV